MVGPGRARSGLAAHRLHRQVRGARAELDLATKTDAAVITVEDYGNASLFSLPIVENVFIC